MSIGALDQRAELLANTLEPDGGGGFTGLWQVFAQVWVRIIPLPPSEKFSADRLESKARHRLVLRHRADLACGQRVRVGTRLFQIQGLQNDTPRAAYITLYGEELP